MIECPYCHSMYHIQQLGWGAGRMANSAEQENGIEVLCVSCSHLFDAYVMVVTEDREPELSWWQSALQRLPWQK